MKAKKAIPLDFSETEPESTMIPTSNEKEALLDDVSESSTEKETHRSYPVSEMRET